MKKLNDIIKNHKLEVKGFPAFKELEGLSNQEASTVTLATDAPVKVLEFTFGGVTYYSPVIPRNSRFTSGQDVIDADLDVQIIHAQFYNSDRVPINRCDCHVIVSRHEATIEVLKHKYPKSIILRQNISPEDIFDKHVVGTLPPNLANYAKSYTSVTIKNFDCNKDGDLAGDELAERLEISVPVIVSVLSQGGGHSMNREEKLKNIHNREVPLIQTEFNKILSSYEDWIDYEVDGRPITVQLHNLENGCRYDRYLQGKSILSIIETGTYRTTHRDTLEHPEYYIRIYVTNQTFKKVISKEITLSDLWENSETGDYGCKLTNVIIKEAKY